MATIRKAQHNDIPAIADMHTQLQHHIQASNPHIWRTTTDQTEADYTDPTLITYIAEKDNTPAGYISGQIQTREHLTPRTIGYIRTVYVKPEHRHQGLGHNLVKTLCNHYTTKKVDEVNLRYVIGNKEAEAFWAKLGFRPIIVTANTPLEKLNATLQVSC